MSAPIQAVKGYDFFLTELNRQLKQRPQDTVEDVPVPAGGDTPLNAALRVATVLSRHAQPVTIQELARIQGYGTVPLVKHLSLLEKLGAVRIDLDRDTVTLTDDGRAFAALGSEGAGG